MTPEDFASPEEILDGLIMCGHLDDVDNLECRPWMRMIIAIDHGGDFQLLLDIMRMRTAPAPVAPYLRDLFERRGLIRGVRRHKDSIPLYGLTHRDMEISTALAGVKEWMEHGATLDEAIELESKESGIPETTLGNAYYKRRGATNRRKARSKNTPV
jgi:hypothetical protein